MRLESRDDRARLGYGLLDMQVGDWVASNDVATFTHVRHPELDNKYQARRLLEILGKRFATTEAQEMWAAIEQYREDLARRFGPPGQVVGLIEFEQAANEWYETYGLLFEKHWYLRAPFDLNYARTGREIIGGHWLTRLHPNFKHFTDAGFSPWLILKTLHLAQFDGWFATWRLLRRAEPAMLDYFWLRLAAYFLRFNLTVEQVEIAMREIKNHAKVIEATRNAPVSLAEAALDYFRRLEFARLGPEVIGIEDLFNQN